MKAKEIMSRVLFCCTPEETAEKAAQMMRDHDIGSVPVISDNTERKLLGIVTDRDICMKVTASGQRGDAVKLSEVMTPWPATCSPEDSVESCEEVMRRRQVRRIPIVDARGTCVGIVSQADIALHDTAEHAFTMLAAVSQHAHYAGGKPVFNH
jgi:CBS domain-containing protein